MTEITRKSILAEAERCVCTDREQQYGSPEENFVSIAALWNAYKPCGFTAHDVAIMMALLKIGRIASGHEKADNWIDLAGYAACGGEIQSAEDNPAEARNNGRRRTGEKSSPYRSNRLRNDHILYGSV